MSVKIAGLMTMKIDTLCRALASGCVRRPLFTCAMLRHESHWSTLVETSPPDKVVSKRDRTAEVKPSSKGVMRLPERERPI